MPTDFCNNSRRHRLLSVAGKTAWYWKESLFAIDAIPVQHRIERIEKFVVIDHFATIFVRGVKMVIEQPNRERRQRKPRKIKRHRFLPLLWRIQRMLAMFLRQFRDGRMIAANQHRSAQRVAAAEAVDPGDGILIVLIAGGKALQAGIEISAL